MNWLGITRVGLGLLGVLAAVEGLARFPLVMGSAAVVSAQLGTPAGVFAVLLPFVLVWVMSYLLVFRNLSLARLLVAQAEELSGGESSGVPQVIVGLAGLLIIAYALPGLISSLSLILIEGVRTSELTRLTVAVAAQAGLGLLLVVRPSRVVRTLTSSGAEAT